MTTGTRKAGEFCWINVMTPQPAEARKFFAALLGWETPEMAGMGYRVQAGGRHIGGLFDVVSDRTPNGMAPVIGVMVKVDDADAMAARVRALGGTAQPAFDIADAGRMAVCYDPNGGEFDVWQPKQMQGTDVDSALHGAPAWFETITSNAHRARTFYCDLFGWTAEDTVDSPVAYTHFKRDGVPLAGMFQLTPDMAPMKSHWGVYFTVNDVDACARDAVKLGGSLSMAPQDIPNVGRFCGVISPQGVMFYAIKYNT